MSGSPIGSAHNSDTENDPRTPGKGFRSPRTAFSLVCDQILRFTTLIHRFFAIESHIKFNTSAYLLAVCCAFFDAFASPSPHRFVDYSLWCLSHYCSSLVQHEFVGGVGHLLSYHRSSICTNHNRNNNNNPTNWCSFLLLCIILRWGNLLKLSTCNVCSKKIFFLGTKCNICK